ncbi:MAG: hypothetical protein LHV69_06245 [Elusimicrobia bacterium]|nr:hypothetical protein [Candidatus Obscuribacterium magneticum]
MKRLVLLVIGCVVVHTAWAFDVPFRERTADGGFPGEWLTSFAASARDAGLANASTALTGSAAAYSNPAGIIGNQVGEASFMVAPLYSAGRFQSVCVSYPFGQVDTAGLTFLSLDSGMAERTDVFGQSNGGFDEQNLAFLLTYGRRMLEGGLDAGVNLKVLRQSMAGFSATGYGTDVGIQIRPFGEFFNFGLSFQNIMPPSLKLKEDKDKFPLIVKSGAALNLKLFDRSFLLCSDMTSPKGGSVRWGFGLEIQPTRSTSLPLFVRFGMNQKEYSMGFGVEKGLMALDYAASFHELEILHRFGVTIRFGNLPSLAEDRLRNEWERVRRKETSLKRMKYELGEEKPDDADAGTYQRARQEEGNRKRTEAQWNKALKYYADKHYRECIMTLEEAAPFLDDDIEASVLNAMAHAQVYIEVEDYERALQQLLKAVELNPDHQEAKRLYERVKDIKEAYENKDH